MNRLKITSKGWETYTGYLGMVEFQDGVSVRPVDRVLSDRIASAVSMVFVDESGVELDPAGPAHRIVGGATVSVDPSQMDLASDEELAEEAARIAAELPPPPPDVKIHSLEELEEIAGKKGINALREVAKPWGVRDRSIPGLIAEILKAQADYVAKGRDGQERLVDSAKNDAPAIGGIELSALTANMGETPAPDAESEAE